MYKEHYELFKKLTDDQLVQQLRSYMSNCIMFIDYDMFNADVQIDSNNLMTIITEILKEREESV